MEKAKYLICMILVFQTVTSQNNGCFTPNDESGVCINIKRCQPFLTLIENQRKNSSVVAFLRNSVCGYEGKEPKVCCPLENEYGSTTEFSPTRTTTPGFGNQMDYSTISSSRLPSQSTCGKTNTSINSIIKVLADVPAELGDWPWMVALGYRDLSGQTRDLQWLCGGALIADRYVLTAAYCTVDIKNRKLAVAHLADLNLDPNVRDGTSAIDITIERIITHEQYNAQQNTNNIALLKLENKVRYSEFIQPICLPLLPEIRSNKLVKKLPFVAGWGSIRGPSTTTLMRFQISVFDNSDCKHFFANKRTVIDDRVLCAGYVPGGKNACQGDFGGPLMWRNGNQYYLMGIVSSGFKCDEPNPGVYTRVTSFIDWIVDNVNNS